VDWPRHGVLDNRSVKVAPGRLQIVGWLLPRRLQALLRSLKLPPLVGELPVVSIYAIEHHT
jgi:hypothetical protein